MGVTQISRDYGVNVSIVRFSTTDSLSQVAMTNYVLSQSENITIANSGEWTWINSDMVLMLAMAASFTINSTFTTLTIYPNIAPPSGASMLYEDGASETWSARFIHNPFSNLRSTDIISISRGSSSGAGKIGTLTDRGTSIFVNEKGDDTNGNGSLLSPYQTVQGAMGGIAGRGDASITKQYTVFMEGEITDPDLTLLPWVNLFSDGSPWYVSTVALDTSFNSAVNIFSCYQNINFGTTCNMDLTFTDAGSSSGALNFINCTSSPTTAVNFYPISPNNAHRLNLNNCQFGDANAGNNASVVVPMGGCASLFIEGGIIPNEIDFLNTSSEGNYSTISLSNCFVPESIIRANQGSLILNNMSILYDTIASITLASAVSVTYDDANYLTTLTQTGSGNNFRLIQKFYPPDYVDGLELTFTGLTTLNVGNGNCIDSTNHFILNDSSNSYGLDISTNGAGGLDTGSATQGLIYIYKIWKSSDPTAINVVASTNNAAPNLSFDPTYNLFRRVGYWVVNSSAQLDAMTVTGSSNQRTYYVASSDPAFTVLSGGTATTSTGVSCSAVAPGFAEVCFSDTMNPGAVANTGYNLVGPAFAGQYFRRVLNVSAVSATNSTGFVPLDNSAQINYIWDTTSSGRSLTLIVSQIREYI